MRDMFHNKLSYVRCCHWIGELDSKQAFVTSTMFTLSKFDTLLAGPLVHELYEE